MRQNRTSYNSETTRTVNSDGEFVEETRRQTVRHETEPNYVKMYIRDIGNLHELHNSTKDVLNQLVARMDYDNKVIIIKHVKEEIILACDIKEVTFEKSITELIKNNIISRISRGYYSINAHYFAKGSWPHIKEIRMNVTYNGAGRTINVETE